MHGWPAPLYSFACAASCQASAALANSSRRHKPTEGPACEADVIFKFKTQAPPELTALGLMSQ